MLCYEVMTILITQDRTAENGLLGCTMVQWVVSVCHSGVVQLETFGQTATLAQIVRNLKTVNI